MVKLGVNVDHVATLRQARKVAYPDPLEAAMVAEKAGADAITLHLREDRRHIADHDLFRIASAIKVRINQELAPTEEMVEIALKVKPDEVCFVPERREELTTEGGLDVVALADRIAPMIKRLREAADRNQSFRRAGSEATGRSQERWGQLRRVAYRHLCHSCRPGSGRSQAPAQL